VKLTTQQLRNIITKYATLYANQLGLDKQGLEDLGVAIAMVENRPLDAKARNKSSTARGIMQVLICTQREVEAKYLKIDFPKAQFPCKYYPNAPVGTANDDKMYDADYNVRVGMRYLAYQVARYKGDYYKAAYAYHKGSYPVKDDGGGKSYANKALAQYDLARRNQPIENKTAIYQANREYYPLILEVKGKQYKYFFG